METADECIEPAGVRSDKPDLCLWQECEEDNEMVEVNEDDDLERRELDIFVKSQRGLQEHMTFLTRQNVREKEQQMRPKAINFLTEGIIKETD